MDLARFHTYAQFVREIDTYSFRRSTFLLTPPTWIEFEGVLVPGCLPNLRSLIKHDLASSTVEPMRVFLSHNLRRLEYNFYGLDRDHPSARLGDDPIAEPAAGWIAGLFAGVAHNASDVRLFQLTLPRSMNAVLRASELFPAAVPKLSSVVSLQIPYNIPIPPSALSYLAGYSQLHRLALVIRCEEYPAGVPDIPHGSFPALRTARFAVDSTLWCVAFLSKVCSPQLASLTLDINASAKPDDCHALFTTLADHPSAAVLETLYLRHNGPLNDPPVTVPRFALLPLCSLPSVRVMRLDCVALDDDTLLQMVRAWPQLQIADLCRLYGTYGAPRVTLSGLGTIVEHCNNLHTLNIHMEDIGEQEVSALLKRKPPSIWETQPHLEHAGVARVMRRLYCPLTRLGVGPSMIAEADVGGVAAVLSQWFPDLNLIDHHPCQTPSRPAGGDAPPVDPNFNESEQHIRWETVADLIPAMALARAQEQLWGVQVQCTGAYLTCLLVTSLSTSYSTQPSCHGGPRRVVSRRPESLLFLRPSYRRHLPVTHRFLRLHPSPPLLPFVCIDTPAQPPLIIDRIARQRRRAQHALSCHACPELRRRSHPHVHVEVLRLGFLRPFSFPQVLQTDDGHAREVWYLQSRLAHAADPALIVDFQRDPVPPPSQYLPDAPHDVRIVRFVQTNLCIGAAIACGRHREDSDSHPDG